MYIWLFANSPDLVTTLCQGVELNIWEVSQGPHTVSRSPNNMFRPNAASPHFGTESKMWEVSQRPHTVKRYQPCVFITRLFHKALGLS